MVTPDNVKQVLDRVVMVLSLFTKVDPTGIDQKVVNAVTQLESEPYFLAAVADVINWVEQGGGTTLVELRQLLAKYM